MKQQTRQTQEKWLKVLGKGMVTIPKRWRDELGFSKGDILKAKKKVNKIIIEFKEKAAPYRVYSKAELTKFIKDDALI